MDARRLWHRDFASERDARIGADGKREATELRSLQGRRGLVTWQMRAELRAALDEGYGATGEKARALCPTKPCRTERSTPG